MRLVSQINRHHPVDLERHEEVVIPPEAKRFYCLLTTAKNRVEKHRATSSGQSTQIFREEI